MQANETNGGICLGCNHHSGIDGCSLPGGRQACYEANCEEPEAERCPSCGRMIEVGTDCAHCVAGAIEAGNYAAEGRAWERDVLRLS